MTKRSIILGCIVAVFGCLLGASVFLLKQKWDFKQSIAVIPDFCLPQVMDSLQFCHTQLIKGNPFVLMYVHPECEICQTEARQIQQKASNAKDIQWVLVSYAERESLCQFMETYQLADIPGLVMLMDSQFVLHDQLEAPGIPTSYVYNSQHQLVSIVRGISRLDKLIQLANH